tara:strand:+ start:128 stop:493 length:366 start_codon:yes stop_codon:yes gene_type:complete
MTQTSTQTRPKYEAYGINIEEVGDTTHVFKDGELIGSFFIDITNKTLKFDFPNNKYFNYFAYMASDPGQNRVHWVNENLKQESLDQLQAGVAFLGFAKFEELMANDKLDRESTGSTASAVH